MGDAMRSQVRGASRPLGGPDAPDRASGRAGSWHRPSLGSGDFLGARHLVDRRQGGLEQLAQAPNVVHEPLALGGRCERDPPCLDIRLLDDPPRLPARRLPLFLGGGFRGYERLAEERLELAVPLELGLQALDLVRELGSAPPHVFVARRDLLEQTIDSVATVAPDAAAERHMVDLNRRQSHSSPPSHWNRSSSEIATRPAMKSTITAIIGERPRGARGGRMRLKSRRYGSQTSYRKRWIRLSQIEYGRRIHDISTYAKIRST